MGRFGQAGHAEDFSGNGYEHLGTVVDDDVLDVELEVVDRTVDFGVGREAVLCLGDADGIVGDAHFLGQLDHLAGGAAVGHYARAIESGGDFLDFLHHRIAFVVGKFEGTAGLAVDGIDHEACQVGGSLTAFGKGVVDGKSDVEVVFAMAADGFHLLVRVAGKAVEGQYDGLAEVAQVAHVLVEVAEALAQSFHVGILDAVEAYASVHLEALGRGHDDRQLGLQTAFAAFDVVEFLCTEVGTESCLGDHVVGKGHGHLGGDDGVAAVGDVGERASMDKGSRAFGGLYEVGMYGIFQEYGDGAGNAEFSHREGLAVESEAEDDALDAAAQVGRAGGEAEDGHEFRSGGDVETALRSDAVGAGAESGDDAAQAAVVHVEHAAPDDFLESKSVGLMLVEVVVEEGGNHVVGRGDGVEVAREVEVDFLHGEHLGISASGRTALHAEAGAERRFAQGDDSFLAYLVESEGEADAHRGLADACLGGGDGGDEDEIALLDAFLVNEAFRNFGDVAAVILYFVAGNADAFGYTFDFLEFYAAGNFDVRFHVSFFFFEVRVVCHDCHDCQLSRLSIIISSGRTDRPV